MPNQKSNIKWIKCYKPFVFEEVKPTDEKKRFIDAISDSLRQSMEHDNLVVMGQDVAEYGGAFKITDGFVTNLERTCDQHRFVRVPSRNGIVHQWI
jgi:alpha-mannosidase